MKNYGLSYPKEAIKSHLMPLLNHEYPSLARETEEKKMSFLYMIKARSSIEGFDILVHSKTNLLEN